MIEALVLAHLLYSYECCSNHDCRPVPCAQIEDLGQGWKWQDRIFTRQMLRISDDGLCHVCFNTKPMCIYLPANT